MGRLRRHRKRVNLRRATLPKLQRLLVAATRDLHKAQEHAAVERTFAAIPNQSALLRMQAARRVELNAQQWWYRVTKAIEQHARKRERNAQLRAAAAGNTKKQRQVGLSIKRQMSRSRDCPYCGSDLGGDPHCDHIYPISKGGRSTTRNMVWVCSGCNTKKRDLTLAAFIRDYQLHRDAIELRLQALGKEF